MTVIVWKIDFHLSLLMATKSDTVSVCFLQQ